MKLFEIYERQSLILDYNYYPNDKTIISSDLNSNPISLFSDDVWDLSIYSNDVHVKKIYFDLDEIKDHPNKKLVEDLKINYKLICYALLNFKLTNKGYTKVTTLIGDVQHVKYFLLLCLRLNLRATEINDNPFLINQFKEDLKKLQKSTQKKRLYVMSKLRKISQYFNEHNFGFSEKVIDTIFSEVKKLPNTNKQTLIIPSNIYSKFIQNGAELFEEYLEIRESIEAWFEKVAESKSYACTNSRARKGVEFNETIAEHSLTKYCIKYSITDRQEFLYHIKNIQFYAYFYFLCFTGMRANEAMSCAYNAFEKKVVKHSDVYTVRAYTSKLVGMKPVSALWVTSKNLEPANQVAQSICRIGLKYRKLCYIDSLVESEVPLFFSFYHRDTELSTLFPEYALTAITFSDNFKKLINNCVLTQEDFDEAVKMQPSILFGENESVVVGELWSFAPHQFRRTLAVYCSRSGLVSLPALKNQLKHIEVDMTAYYADGAMFAEDISKQDFISEFQDELIEAECDQYFADRENQELPLFGGHGTWLEVNKLSMGGVDFLENRTKTLKGMKDNRIAYKQTPLGGCTMNGSCDKLSLAHISACVTCPQALFNDRSLKALTILKKSLSKVILRFEESSPYRQQTDLEIKAIDKLLEKISV